MPNAAYLHTLDTLRRHLDAAVGILRNLDSDAAEQVVAEEPDRWGLVADSLSAAIAPGEMGSVQQLLTALSAALDDR
jgi:hypothetical protein